MEKISFNMLNLFPHNKVSYRKIKKSFSDGEKFVAIVHATGTGKNYNFLQLLLDNPFKKFVNKVYLKFLNWVSHIDIPLDTDEFKLYDRKGKEKIFRKYCKKRRNKTS